MLQRAHPSPYLCSATGGLAEFRVRQRCRRQPLACLFNRTTGRVIDSSGGGKWRHVSVFCKVVNLIAKALRLTNEYKLRFPMVVSAQLCSKSNSWLACKCTESAGIITQMAPACSARL